MQGYQNFKKYACKNTAAMEMSNRMDQQMSHQIVAI